MTAPGRHGTNAGYQAHIDCRIPPCQPCKTAHAQAAYRHRHGPERERRRAELERLTSPPRPDPVDVLWRRLLDLIAGECQRAGMLP